jgi:hypothetical protein
MGRHRRKSQDSRYSIGLQQIANAELGGALSHGNPRQENGAPYFRTWFTCAMTFGADGAFLSRDERR